MSKVINEAEFNEMIKTGVTVIDMFATWCPPCKIMAPAFDESGEELSGQAKFAKVNIDDDGAVAMKYGVQMVPTILIFKDGELKDRIIGVVSKEQLKSQVEQVL